MRAETSRSPGQDGALAGLGLLLVLTATAATAPLVSGAAWWWSGAAVAAASLAAGFGLRAARVPAGFVPPAEILVALGAVTVLFGRGAVLGVVPTAATAEGFGELLRQAAVAIREEAAPAADGPGLRFVLAVGAGVVAVAVDILIVGLRAPAFAVLPAAVPMAIPLVILGEIDLVIVVVVAAVYLLLLWTDMRIRRADAGTAPPGQPRVVSRPPRAAPAIGSALALAGVGLVAASLLAVSLPMARGGVGVGAVGVGSGVTPFVDLASDLRRPAARPVLHYTTSDDTRPYFTLMTLDRFEGAQWTTSAGGIDESRTVDAIDDPAGLDAGIPRSEVGVRVWIDRLDSPWLPVPAPATRVTGLAGDWYWDQETRTVRSPSASADEQSYRVTRLDVEPSAEQLRAASLVRPPGEYDAYRELPGELPPLLAQTIAEVTADSASPYDAATKIQAYLRGPDFTYSLDTPVRAGYDGGSLEVITDFLEVGSGYCVHFASAMAVMARAIGIPARIALGYMPGESDGTLIGGKVRRNVDTHDLHTWPELYFAGVGWVPFEPTPGRGVVPDYSRVSVAPAPVTGTDSPTAPASDPATVPTASPAPTAAPGVRDDLGADAAAESGPAPGSLLLAAAVLLLLAVPAAIRAAVSAVRRRRMRGGGPSGARAAWLELRDRAVDLGADWDDTMTARAFAGRLGLGPPDAAALGRIVAAYERAEYAPPRAGAAGAARSADVPSAGADAALVLRALGAGATVRRRVIAAAAPRSLALLVQERVRAPLRRA